MRWVVLRFSSLVTNQELPLLVVVPASKPGVVPLQWALFLLRPVSSPGRA